MVQRGNKGQECWTCSKCASRWKRKDLALMNSESADPMSEDLVTFGKHMGKTYAQVFLEDQ